MSCNKIPPVPVQVLERKRITELFDGVFSEARILYISAHTGWGKTTAAAIWAKGHVCLWLSGQDSKNLINHINTAENESKRRQYVIIDDFQQLSETDRAYVAGTILCGHLKYLILSRCALPASFKAALGRGLQVLGIDEMRFTVAECDKFLTLSNISSLNRERILQERIGSGWILSLQHIVQALRGAGSDYSPEIRYIATESIFSYFDAEILAKYSRLEQDFLMVIGAFPRLSIVQMERLTGCTDTRKIMGHFLLQGSFFVEVGEGIYQIHPFFQKYIERTRNKRLLPSEQRKIYKNAGREFEKTEEFAMALYAYKMGADTESLALLLEHFSKDGVGKSDIWANRSYYRSLTQEQILESPVLCSSMAMLELISFHLERAAYWESQLQDMLTGLSEEDSRYRDIKSQLDYLSVALPYKHYPDLFAMLVHLAGYAHNYSLNPQRISITGNRPSVLNGGRDLSQYITDAQDRYRRMDTVVCQLFGSDAIGTAQVFYAESLYQQNHIAAALAQVVAIIPLIEQKGEIATLFSAFFIQMEIMLVSNQIPTTRPMFESMYRRSKEVGAHYLYKNMDALRCWIAMYDGDYETINHWMNHAAPDETDKFCTQDRYQYFIKLRVYLVRDKHLSFLALAEKLRPVLIAFDRQMELCELNMLQALSLYAQHFRNQAFDSLKDALEIAEKRELKRLLADEGERMYILMREYARERADTPFIQEILTLSRAIGLIYPNYLKAQKSTYPSLSDTELTVLCQMAAAKTNDEIAQFLNVSVRTVKFHSGNIFSKLTVKNRIQAVQLAKEIGLLGR